MGNAKEWLDAGADKVGDTLRARLEAWSDQAVWGATTLVASSHERQKRIVATSVHE